jgi:hypothetical protein
MHPGRVADGDRLKAALSRADMTYPELAARMTAAGLPTSRDVVYQMVAGTSRITTERRAVIAAILATSVDEIWNVARGGYSTGGFVEAMVVRESRTADGFTRTAAVRSWRSALAASPGEFSDVFETDGYVEVPTAFLIGGASGIENHDVVRVSGGSMVPRVEPGDRLVFVRDAEPRRNSIVLATSPDGLVVVKVIRWTRDRWELHSVADGGAVFADLTGWTIHGYAVARLGDDSEPGYNTEWRGGQPLKA